eukprot:CAMPEP_0185845128 /NCGR_PEP_ID=MMETSP1354-20130828/1185_1 /TAXON_ID=708628 /ORGANISM="Erythrolobus madagascarensis, Strain CCMP3276" /LENGTH=235 /DNA_ID=CAMNT_0028545023 /DNA_START=78 /DNA_END=785 /DNA_ORIENTATION=-
MEEGGRVHEVPRVVFREERGADARQPQQEQSQPVVQHQVQQHEQHQCQRVLTELYVIYDADGTVAGELAYLVKKWLGRGHCGACSITHGPRREKPEFTHWKLSLDVPVSNIHRDEMHIELYDATRSRAFPCVVGRVSSGNVRENGNGGNDNNDAVCWSVNENEGDEYVYIMDPSELNSCDGDLVKFQHVLSKKMFGMNVAAPATSSTTTQQPATTCCANSGDVCDNHQQSVLGMS